MRRVLGISSVSVLAAVAVLTGGAPVPAGPSGRPRQTGHTHSQSGDTFMATTTTRYFVRALYVADAGGEMTKDRALERAKLEMEAFTRALTGAEGEERQQLAFRCGLGGIAYEVRESSGHTHSGRVEVSDYLTGERLQMTTVGLREWRSFHRARAHNSVFFRTLMEHAADHKLAGLVGQEGEQDVEYMDDERGNGDPFVDDASEREALLLAALEAVRTDVMTDPAAFRGASFFRITSQTLRQVQEAVIRCRA